MTILNPIITGGGGAYAIKKYGVTITNVAKDVQSSGYYYDSYTPVNFNGTGIKEINQNTKYAFAGKFNNVYANSTFSLPDVEKIECDSCFERAFDSSYFSSITAPNLKRLKGDSICNFMNGYNTTLTTLNLPLLEYAQGQNGFYRTFYNCSRLNTVFLPKLLNWMDGSLVYAYCYALRNLNFNSVIYGEFGYQCLLGASQITLLNFPMLQSLASSSSTNTFQGCSNLKLHFRKDMETTIKALSGYPTAWGAGSSSSVFFDLIGEIVFDGETYKRDEYYSKYNGTTETRFAWTQKSIVVNGETYEIDYKKCVQGNYYSIGSDIIAPDFSIAWSNSNRTIYTKLDDGYIPAVGSQTYTDTQHKALFGGTVTSASKNIIFTRAGAEPAVGDYVYADDETALGTITGVR